MSNLIEFLTSKEVVVVYVLAGIALVVAFLFYIVEKTYNKRQLKNNTKELNKLVEKVAEAEKGQTVVQETVVPEVRPAVETIVGVSEVKPVEVVQPVSPINATGPIVEELKVEEIKPVVQEPFIVEDQSVVEVMPEVIEKLEEPQVEENIEIKEQKNVVSSIVEEDNKQVEEIIEYGDNEPDMTTAQQELQKLTMELKKAEEEKKNIDLTEFELRQEENAIISLDELMAKGNTLYEVNEEIQYNDEGEAAISIQDLEARMKNIRKEAELLEVDIKKVEPEIEVIGEPIVKNINTTMVVETEPVVENKIKLDDFHTVGKEKSYQAKTNFKNSPIISPIYGIENLNAQANDLELEDTANYDKLDEEIRKTNEFLMTLKELQKKLD